MTPTEKTPSELIDHIADLIKERESKELPTYYTISIEQYEKLTPVAEKEAGYENFKKQIQKYIANYQLNGITVQLYSGKSRNVKHPFQSFKISLKKQSPTVVLGSSIVSEPTPEIQQLDSSIPVGRYYDEKFELQMRIMRTEMEKTNLLERLTYLQERYEDKLKEQESRTAEKLKHYEEEIEDLEDQIQDFEKEIIKGEKDKHNSFGNVALGSIGARIVESFAKSDIGTGVLKGLLGTEGYSTLQGHLAGIENNPATTEAPKETARIITAPANDPRQNTLAFIQQVCETLPDSHLRMLYDICEMSQKNIGDLQVLWNVAQQIINQRKQAAPENKTPDNDHEEETDDDIDTSKIE
jgi:hypothetical protein